MPCKQLWAYGIIFNESTVDHYVKLMAGISPWMLATAKQLFPGQPLPHLHQHQCGGFTFTTCNVNDACWVTTDIPGGGRLAFRAAYAPNDVLNIKKTSVDKQNAKFSFECGIGTYTVDLTFPQPGIPLFRCTTTLKPAVALRVPFWPRDLVPLGKQDVAAGTVHVQQRGLRAGLLYGSITRPAGATFLYFQNLTALAAYNEATCTSAADTVGGTWPEVGFALPASAEKALEPGRSYILSDAFLLFDKKIPAQEFDLAETYLNMLAGVYLHLPKPATRYIHWPDVLHKSLEDLVLQSGCWTQAASHPYLNAYNCDYKTPPEIMVQMAVLLPLLDYEKWSGEKMTVIAKLKDGLSAFFDEKIKSIGRWLPSHEEKLDGSEEHKKPRIMDSWYLHHPLLNLSRMALKGDKDAADLFLRSIPYTIKVARHFKYNWPVFYNIDTLEVIKAETQPGKGGEKDVAGIYAHVLLQAYELTGENRYLLEAKRAARSLRGKGFELFYQANNTAFSAGALLRLFKYTGDRQYLRLSYLCLANVFTNIWMWDCEYGYAKAYPTFFALFPLSDAPYTAVYEEQEGFSAFHDYLAHSKGEEVLPAVSILMAEFIRYLLHRAAYYYPPLLPEDMLTKKPVSGELNPKLWIPLEDLQDGWKQSGSVGQEVYGAGLPFALVPRHYYIVKEGSFKLFLDYPSGDYTASIKQRTLRFAVQGDERLTCRLLLIPLNGKPLPAFTVTGTRGRKQQEYAGHLTPQQHLEYEVHGNQKITITWTIKKTTKNI